MHSHAEASSPSLIAGTVLELFKVSSAMLFGVDYQLVKLLLLYTIRLKSRVVDESSVCVIASVQGQNSNE